VFENRVLNRIFGPKKDDVMGEWRKLHIEELHNMYSSPDIIRQIISRRMRWARCVACMGEERKLYRASVGKTEGKSYLEDQSVDGRMCYSRSGVPKLFSCHTTICNLAHSVYHHYLFYIFK
jgi:hypothetical protein